MGSPGSIAPGQFVVLFDGVCNLCNASVQFIIKRDTKGKFKFASLQSSYGRQQLTSHGFNPDALHSIFLLHDGMIYQRSDAALEIAKNLSGIWPIFYGFKIVPRFIRDGVYNWIARNRYSFFGKSDSCWIPTPEVTARFIE